MIREEGCCDADLSDPCACKGTDPSTPPVCNADGTSVVSIDLRYCDLRGTIAEEVGAFKDLATFDVSTNYLTGPLPASVSKWSKLKDFDVRGNRLDGRPLPALPFATMSSCFVLNNHSFAGGNNTFWCPWPVGATEKCVKGNGIGDVNVTAADCKALQDEVGEARLSARRGVAEGQGGERAAARLPAGRRRRRRWWWRRWRRRW
jgi:hypothetical protein